MIFHPNRRRRVFLVIVGPTICVISYIPTGAMADALSRDAVAALEHNARALDPIIIGWTRERATSLSEEDFFKIVKGPRWAKGDTTFLALATGEFKYQDGNVYRYVREKVPLLDFAVKVDTRTSAPEKGKMPPLKCIGTREMEIEVAFDGDKIYHGSRQEGGIGPPILIIARLGDLPLKGREDVPIFPFPYLDFAGLKVPYSPRDYAQHVKMRSLIQHLLERGCRLSQSEWKTENGAGYLGLNLVDHNGSYLFELDPSRNYAVRRYEERTTAGERTCLADMSDFREVPGKKNVWLPERCVVHYYQWEGKPAIPLPEALLVESYTITKCESEPIPDRDFVVFYDTPGARIGDATLPNAEKAKGGEISYVVPADSRDLDEVIQHAIAGTSFTPSLSRPHRLAQIIILLNVGVILVITFFVRRHRRAARLR